MIKALSYKDISLVPRKPSYLSSRDEADTSIIALGQKWALPMIASPMPDVCSGEMANILSQNDCLGIIHRFQSIESQKDEFNSCQGNKYKVGCAIGVTGDYKDRFQILYDAGCRIFCIDTANGFHIQTKKAIMWLGGGTETDIKLIVGNIATGEGYHWLTDCLLYNGFNDTMIRVGLAGGSVCETKTETGVYVPMVTSIRECYERKDGLIKTGKYDMNHMPKIIADGGIQTPSDMCKALAVGADMVMCGSVFAGTEEAPGQVHNIDGDLIKLYQGAASFGVQKNHRDKEPDYVEGRESFVPYKGKVKKILNRFSAGLKSSMSYMNALNLHEYKQNVDVINI